MFFLSLRSRGKNWDATISAHGAGSGFGGGRSAWGGDVTSEGPAGVLETHAVAPDAKAAAAATIALTQEQKKLLEAAKKKVKLIVLKKMLQSVGVSTTGDGSSLLAQDSRSKESQLENASIVAALVAGMTRGMRSIYVSVEIAEYVALLQKYDLLDDTATLADKLHAMPRTKSKEANRVRDALAKKARSAAVESSPVDEYDDDDDDDEDDAIDEYQDALREQEEKEDGVQKRTKQLREKTHRGCGGMGGCQARRLATESFGAVAGCEPSEDCQGRGQGQGSQTNRDGA